MKCTVVVGPAMMAVAVLFFAILVSAQEKPGDCPKPTPSIGICQFDPKINCKSDDLCPGYQKCCSDGCNKVCLYPAASLDMNEKEGDCPEIVINGSCGSIPVYNCTGDDSCPGNQKCFSDGCDRNCQIPKATNFPKPGTCPEIIHGGGSCSIVSIKNCIGDNSCPGDQLCCIDGCDYHCRNPNSAPEKRGICPTVKTNPNSCGSTVHVKNCTGDASCPESKKCCFDGCNFNCQYRVGGEPPEPLLPKEFLVGN